MVDYALLLVNGITEGRFLTTDIIMVGYEALEHKKGRREDLEAKAARNAIRDAKCTEKQKAEAAKRQRHQSSDRGLGSSDH